MGQSTSIPADVDIVVVGGGYAGNALAQKLFAAKARFTLIDSSDVFRHCIGAPRVIAVPGTTHKILIPFEETYGSHFRRGKVIGLDPGNNVVHLEGGDEVKYEILVLATGTNGPFPSKAGHASKEAALHDYEQYAAKVRDSGKISLIGGGAVGVEIAGEIATAYPEKEVTLIHTRSTLVAQNLTSGTYKKIDSALKTLGVKVIKEERVTNLDDLGDGPGQVVTDRNSHIDADLVIQCTGLTVNKEGYMAGLGHVTDERGALRIEKNFLVEGYDNIFAIGDCCASGDAWFAFLAMEHAKIVLQNIAKKQKGQELISYKGHAAPIKIGLAVGKNYGFGEFKSGRAVPDFLVKMFKSKDLMVGRMWKDMKQKAPK